MWKIEGLSFVRLAPTITALCLTEALYAATVQKTHNLLVNTTRRCSEMTAYLSLIADKLGGTAKPWVFV